MFQALLVAPDSVTRLSLRTLGSHLPEFRTITVVRTFEEAIQELSGNNTYDIIFLSYSLGRANIPLFIEHAKQTAAGRQCAYVLIMREHEQQTGAVVDTMIAGIHAFLFAPFSADTVQEISSLAGRVSLATSKTRIKAATSMMIANLVEEAAGPSAPPQGNAKRKKLVDRIRDSSERFQELTGIPALPYYDKIAEALAKMSPSRRVSDADVHFRNSLRKRLMQTRPDEEVSPHLVQKTMKKNNSGFFPF